MDLSHALVQRADVGFRCGTRLAGHDCRVGAPVQRPQLLAHCSEYGTRAQHGGTAALAAERRTARQRHVAVGQRRHARRDISAGRHKSGVAHARSRVCVPAHARVARAQAGRAAQRAKQPLLLQQRQRKRVRPAHVCRRSLPIRAVVRTRRRVREHHGSLGTTDNSAAASSRGEIKSKLHTAVASVVPPAGRLCCTAAAAAAAARGGPLRLCAPRSPPHYGLPREELGGLLEQHARVLETAVRRQRRGHRSRHRIDRIVRTRQRKRGRRSGILRTHRNASAVIAVIGARGTHAQATLEARHMHSERQRRRHHAARNQQRPPYDERARTHTHTHTHTQSERARAHAQHTNATRDTRRAARSDEQRVQSSGVSATNTDAASSAANTRHAPTRGAITLGEGANEPTHTHT
jgi:hypothetical protein